MTVIHVSHPPKQRVDIYADGVLLPVQLAEHGTRVEIDFSPNTSHEILIRQRSLFDRWYWWVSLVPLFWLVSGGMRLNYYLGYNALRAELRFNYRLNRHHESCDRLEFELSMKLIKSNNGGQRAYYMLEGKENGEVQFLPEAAGKSGAYYYKWVASQMVLPLLLIVVFIYSAIWGFNRPLDVIMVLAMCAVAGLIIYRIAYILYVGNTENELKRIKEKSHATHKRDYHHKHR